MRRLAVILLGVILALCCPIQTFASSGVRFDGEQKQEYIIFTRNVETGKAIKNNYDAKRVDHSDEYYVAKLTDRQAKRLQRNDEIVYVEENILLNASTDEEIPEEFNQWYLEAINAQDVADSEQSIAVELIDSGVDVSEDINVYESVNFIEDDYNTSLLFIDNTGHGTSMASIICANKDGYALDGINANVDLYSAKVLDANNQSTLSRIISAIYWGIENDVKIINMSFGTEVDSEILHLAVNDAYNSGILLVAAAGNTEHQAVQYPAAYDEVISVGSVDSQGCLSEITSTGTQLNILAPGEKISTLGFIDGLTTISGTSAATAMVTGVASLVWSEHPEKSNRFMMDLLCSCSNKPASLTGTDAGIIDYEAVTDNYTAFEAAYDESASVVPDFSVSEGYDLSADADLIVDGLWSNATTVDGHYTLSTDALEYAGYDATTQQTEINIVRYACTNTDAAYGTYHTYIHPIGGFHGLSNYVLTLRYLYNVARTVYENGVGTQYDTLKTYYEDTFSDILEQQDNDGVSDSARFDAVADAIEDFLCPPSNDYVTYRSILAESMRSTTNHEYLGLAIFGTALHLAGDMYAHRTIVPDYTVSGTLPSTPIKDTTYHADKFGTNDFGTTSYNNSNYDSIRLLLYNNSNFANYPSYKSIHYLKHMVNDQKVEFRDIGYFLTISGNPYEDDGKFCKERYKASLLACKRIMARFAESGTFYTKLIYPKYYKESQAEWNNKFQTVKLNNFKNYTIVAGLATTGVGLADADWLINSTVAFV